MSGEAPFSTINRRPGRPDRGRFRGQVSGKSPGISPPKFRPTSIGPPKVTPISRAVAPPTIARGKPATYATHASTCANYRPGGTQRTTIKGHRLFDHCRSLPASRCARVIAARTVLATSFAPPRKPGPPPACVGCDGARTALLLPRDSLLRRPSLEIMGLQNSFGNRLQPWSKRGAPEDLYIGDQIKRCCS